VDEKRNAYRILFEEFKAKYLLGVVNIKTYICCESWKKVCNGFKRFRIGTKGELSLFCKHAEKPLGSMKAGNFLTTGISITFSGRPSVIELRSLL
jgi:hypothetical protein